MDYNNNKYVSKTIILFLVYFLLAYTTLLVKPCPHGSGRPRTEVFTCTALALALAQHWSYLGPALVLPWPSSSSALVLPWPSSTEPLLLPSSGPALPSINQEVGEAMHAVCPQIMQDSFAVAKQITRNLILFSLTTAETDATQRRHAWLATRHLCTKVILPLPQLCSLPSENRNIILIFRGAVFWFAMVFKTGKLSGQ